jgi:hypothetical protein
VPVVYMSESPAKSMPAECAVWPLWVAGYVDAAPSDWEDWRVGPWERPAIWQYSSSGNVPGISGRCDVNVAPDDLRARIGLAGVSLPPEPAPQPLTGWPELDRYLQQEGVAINVPPEEWQTTGGTHAATSWHYRGQARDYSAGMGCDEAAVVAALRPFAVEGGPIIELFHAATNTWWPTDVGGHTEHAHAAIAPGASLPVTEEDDLTPEQDRLLRDLHQYMSETKGGAVDTIEEAIAGVANEIKASVDTLSAKVDALAARLQAGNSGRRGVVREVPAAVRLAGVSA